MNSRICALVASLAMVGCTAPGPTGEAARLAQEAQAAIPGAIDCERFATALEVQADTAGGATRSAAPLDRSLKVRLNELRLVSPIVPPERREKSADRFAGLVPVRVAESGTYAVLVGSLAWADLAAADPARPVEPLSFKWLTLCGQRFKSGLYSLAPHRLYYVQFWDSPDRVLTVMIRRLP